MACERQNSVGKVKGQCAWSYIPLGSKPGSEEGSEILCPTGLGESGEAWRDQTGVTAGDRTPGPLRTTQNIPTSVIQEGVWESYTARRASLPLTSGIPSSLPLLSHSHHCHQVIQGSHLEWGWAGGSYCFRPPSPQRGLEHSPPLGAQGRGLRGRL